MESAPGQRSGYVRQLSIGVASVMAFPLAAFMLLVSQFALYGFGFGAPFFLLGLYFICLGQVVAFPFRRRIELPDGGPIMLCAWMLGAPLAGLLVPIFHLFVLAPPLNIVSIAAILTVLHLAATVVLFVRLYRRTPQSASFGGELPEKSLALAVIYFSYYAVASAFLLIALPALLYGVSHLRFEDGPGGGIRLGLILGAAPAVVAGLALIRRGFWLSEIQRRIDELPTSTVLAAAVGPVELKGTARPLGRSEGPILGIRQDVEESTRIVNDFLLDDGTGTVRIRVPKDCVPGVDGTVVLKRRVREEGLQRECRLMPGDPVYVLGAYCVEGGTPEIRPWVPASTRLLLPLINAFFKQDWAVFDHSIDLDRALGLQFSPEIFLVSDLEEAGVRRAAQTHWRWSILFGSSLVVLPLVFLAYAYAFR